ncbi:uncharacterized protein A4U43_C01F31140 [Asparagus officinalis]|uniref:F-box domain-containing protein n=1 Tax=Asparagus officinalis TaxID=4686 RepID=A0A5P1FTI0_ASPOF|nr:F-box/LRR-repeat protein At4g14103-like [Asparagus officinalis]ONK81616.1 uncharacterized protein A4U43_C01F31140 [Asparagus officinalis]
MDPSGDDDRLSSLPDPLLTFILSLMPTKQSITTSILSKRWRYLYRFVTHLHLLDENLLPTSDDDNRSTIQIWESMLNSVQLSVHGPIHVCRISFSPSKNHYILRMNDFLMSLIERGIRELSVMNRGGGGCFYELPSLVFFCSTLEKLELGKCMLSILPPSPSNFSNIRSLILSGVYFTNDQFQQMVSCCRLLETLKVDCCVKVRNFRIAARKLWSLEIITLNRIQISLRDTEQLREATFSFLSAYNDTCIRYYDDSSREEDEDQADRLVQLFMDLSCCYHLERLSLHFCTDFAECLQWQRAEFPLSLPPQYHLKSVKKLDMEISLSNHQLATVLSCLLNSCPNLRELRIKDKEHLHTIGSYWEGQNPSWCLINNLRTIQICKVNLRQSYWMGFIKFLLMNACVCERITIQYYGDPCSKKLVEQKLKMIQWGSPQAILELKPLC